MTKFFMIVALAGAVLAAPVPADAGEIQVKAKKAAKSIRTWFKHWKLALERTVIEQRYRRGVRSTNVAAVRGAGQEQVDPSLPYWKGTWSEKRSKERLKERKELAEAAELILADKFEEAEAKLTAFEKAHPKSSHLVDVEEVREKIKQLRGEDAPIQAEAKKSETSGSVKPAEPAEKKAETKAEGAPANKKAPIKEEAKQKKKSAGSKPASMDELAE